MGPQSLDGQEVGEGRGELQGGKDAMQSPECQKRSRGTLAIAI